MTLKNGVVKGLGLPSLKVVDEIAANGFNVSTDNRTMADILDRLALKYAASTNSDIMGSRTKFMEHFNPDNGTFESFLLGKDTIHHYLMQNLNGPTPAELYHIAKEWVKHVPLMLTAVSHFEMVHPTAAEQNYAAIVTHLTDFAESNAEKLTAHQVINEVKQVKDQLSAPDLTEAVANEVRKQIDRGGGNDRGRAQRSINFVVKTLKAETTIDDAVLQRLIRTITTGLQQEHGGKDVKLCKHHPNATSHTTAECSIETGGRKGQPKSTNKA